MRCAQSELDARCADLANMRKRAQEAEGGRSRGMSGSAVLSTQGPRNSASLSLVVWVGLKVLGWSMGE